MTLSPGRRPIARLLIANRGEIAARIETTAHEMGIATVAVYTEEERLAPFVVQADLAVRLEGVTAAETYLDGPSIVAAAVACGADAIHPGYGFLAESAQFASVVEQAGITFVGPPSAAIAQMADKPAAKAIVAAAGVPVLPGVELDGADRPGWRAAAGGVGYPLLVKASAGGGGRGMRLVLEPSGLEDAVDSASREAGASFGRADVFLERYLAGARHVEVQVAADSAGTVLVLGDRDCSVQRRHQKVIEEAPAPGLSPEVRARLGDAAVAGTRAIDYLGVGTFEFLLYKEEIFFLEMNTRLQVEHPVTEEVTGLDLVRIQLEIASGLPLELSAGALRPSGHAIEARLYAEDPASSYLPSPGTITTWRTSRSPGLRHDSGVDTDSVVSGTFDPLMAKVISHAPTRAEAARRLVRGLDGLVVHGVKTNRAFLMAILEDPDFLDAETTTAFLDERPQLAAAGPSEECVAWHALAVALGALSTRREAARVLSFVRANWRNIASADASERLSGPSGEHTVSYRLVEDAAGSATRVVAAVDGEVLEARLVEWSSSVVDFETARGRIRVHLVCDPADPAGPADAGGGRWYADGGPGTGWHTAWDTRPRWPESGPAEAAAGGITAPIPGVVTALRVSPGQHVEAGDRLVTLEAMKMEHVISAPVAATITAVHVELGASVEAHAVLVSLEPDAP